MSNEQMINEQSARKLVSNTYPTKSLEQLKASSFDKGTNIPPPLIVSKFPDKVKIRIYYRSTFISNSAKPVWSRPLATCECRFSFLPFFIHHNPISFSSTRVATLHFHSPPFFIFYHLSSNLSSSLFYRAPSVGHHFLSPFIHSRHCVHPFMRTCFFKSCWRDNLVMNLA